jgi:hypothetical protein
VSRVVFAAGVRIQTVRPTRVHTARFRFGPHGQISTVRQHGSDQPGLRPHHFAPRSRKHGSPVVVPSASLIASTDREPGTEHLATIAAGCSAARSLVEAAAESLAARPRRRHDRPRTTGSSRPPRRSLTRCTRVRTDVDETAGRPAGHQTGSTRRGPPNHGTTSALTVPNQLPPLRRAAPDRARALREHRPRGGRTAAAINDAANRAGRRYQWTRSARRVRGFRLLDVTVRSPEPRVRETNRSGTGLGRRAEAFGRGSKRRQRRGEPGRVRVRAGRDSSTWSAYGRTGSRRVSSSGQLRRGAHGGAELGHLGCVPGGSGAAGLPRCLDSTRPPGAGPRGAAQAESGSLSGADAHVCGITDPADYRPISPGGRPPAIPVPASCWRSRSHAGGGLASTPPFFDPTLIVLGVGVECRQGLLLLTSPSGAFTPQPHCRPAANRPHCRFALPSLTAHDGRITIRSRPTWRVDRAPVHKDRNRPVQTTDDGKSDECTD